MTLFGLTASMPTIARSLNQRPSRYDPVGSPLAYTNQDIDGRTINGGHNFTGNIDYKLTEKDVISKLFVAQPQALQ